MGYHWHGVEIAGGVRLRYGLCRVVLGLVHIYYRGSFSLEMIL
jgi:hypothetical protein